MLTVQNLAAGYGPAQVLFDISFEVRAGEVVTLSGALAADQFPAASRARTVIAYVVEADRPVTLSEVPAGVPMGAVNTLDAAVAHPQIAARQAIVESTHPVAGTVKMTAPPVRLSETPGLVRSPAPLLGQHTEDVLRQRLALSDSEIARLRRERVIR